LTPADRIRKVKCDETKPHCTRCTSTGRACDGYGYPTDRHKPLQPTPTSSLTRDPSPLPLVSQAEIRALDFFHRAVAPVIAGHIDPSFWTRLVMQVGHQEPAIRHAAMAISSLYEGFGEHMPGQLCQPRVFAVQQYNKAIAKLVSSTDEVVILLSCVLLICIEFLQGDAQTAIQHCRHGISILNNPSTSQTTRDQLVPVFWRLSLFPFFFGCTPETFPVLNCGNLSDLLPTTPTYSPNASTSTASQMLSHLQYTLDILLARSIRFIRTCDPYRLNPVSDLPSPVPPAILAEQHELGVALANWLTAFDAFQQQQQQHSPGTPNLSAGDTTTTLMLQIKHHVATIWVHAAPEFDESVFDQHIDRFRAIVDLASQVHLLDSTAAARAKFTFEPGVLPFLYFVSIKCRCLRTRTAALRLARALGVRQEGLWDTRVLCAVGRTVVELEHGEGAVAMDGLDNGLDGLDEGGEGDTSWPDGDRNRVMDMVMEPEAAGPESMPVSFFLPGENGDVRIERMDVMMGSMCLT
jgi:hypothetical protein